MIINAFIICFKLDFVGEIIDVNIEKIVNIRIWNDKQKTGWLLISVHKNEFPTHNESCHMISCENSKPNDTFVKNILCGKLI